MSDRDRCPQCGDVGLSNVAIHHGEVVYRGTACVCGWLHVKGADGNVLPFRTANARRIEAYLRDVLHAQQDNRRAIQAQPIRRGEPMTITFKL